MLEVINESGVEIDPLPLIRIAELICAEDIPDQVAELTLLICDSKRMRQLNKTYRGKNEDTDVLSFLSESIPSEQAVRGLKCLRGDIVVDINQADRQKGFHSLDTELQYLLIHGLLHLLGHDHIKTQDKEKMEHKETYFRYKLIGAC